MKAESLTVDHLSGSSKPDLQGELQHAQNDSCDPYSPMIHQLIAQKLPIFKIVETGSAGKGEHWELEMIRQKILSYNRKEKSLQELSKKFIDSFERDDEVMFELNLVTKQFGVERRRIYDIVNIFQSLEVVRKASKSNYVWRGLRQAVITITAIIQSDHQIHSRPHKKQKSLEHLASRFLKLFITSRDSPLTLEEVAKELIHNQDSALVKTKIRRLYDIVNVFKSVGLVEKSHLPYHKPRFRWLGLSKIQNIIASKSCKGVEVIVKDTAIKPKEVKKEQIIPEKENCQQISNSLNINDWFSIEQKKVFANLGVMKQFSQKVFFPQVIRKEPSVTTMASQQGLNDQQPEY